MPTHILVTGGAGFIGSNFIHHLASTQPEWPALGLVSPVGGFAEVL